MATFGIVAAVAIGAGLLILLVNRAGLSAGRRHRDRGGDGSVTAGIGGSSDCGPGDAGCGGDGGGGGD